ncbi:MAG TPA: hypothetical protein VMU95_15450 [Trebonia sp.]|nr:hypothetical protein [Trebonia sp.]
MGTRDRIISYLGAVADISDPGGMASTRLAEAVGYPGSSVAFAQLLSGMERDGLIAREVRGKRTYRIILAPGVQPGRARSEGAGKAAIGASSARSVAADKGGPAEVAPALLGAAAQAAPRFDYDELARRLLIQVIRRLATPPDGAEGVLADLTRELTEARGQASSLTAENRQLREQLSQVRHSLEAARASLDGRVGGGTEEPRLTRTGPVGEELTASEVVLLERLVAPARDGSLADDRKQDATAS